MQTTKTLLNEPDADPMLPHLYQIRERRQENRDTFTLDLEPLDEDPVAPFAAGQFNMLYIFGVGEVPISVSGNPADPHRLTHTTRAVGTVTRAMEKLSQGDTLGVRGPFGTTWPVKDAEGADVVIVAGGIGLAPLRPALYHLLDNRDKYGRLILLYGARSQEEMLYPHELEQWNARPDLDVLVTVDRATDDWGGHVGVVTSLIPHAQFDSHDTIAMVCGPEIMMRFTVKGLQDQGVAKEQIYVSMERNMKCATGFCGHCQYGPHFVCKDGPVFSFNQVEPIFEKWEV